MRDWCVVIAGGSVRPGGRSGDRGAATVVGNPSAQRVRV